MNPTSTHPAPDLLRAFIVGKIDDAQAVEVESHLQGCDTCNRFLESHSQDDPFANLVAQANDANRLDSIPGCHDVFPSDTLAKLGGDTTPQPDKRALPGSSIAHYEILDELGRGAMGVVYKARDLRLKRLVALKVILSGEHASQKDRQRFRSEAESIARLHHSGIVQIYEVGECDGRSFLALELVEGGALQQHTDRQPQSPRWSAKLIGQAARAIHYAHQQNIIHRDLKPGNILLKLSPTGSPDTTTEFTGGEKTGSTVKDAAEFSCTLHGNKSGPLDTSMWSSGQPDSLELPVPVSKITDFGLAKQLDSDHGQTQTGMLLGTPWYMAPEQAAAQLHNIGPHSDTYALGAILYELLTGRPPFQTDSVAALLQMVRENEPVPPTRLQPKLPRDLETICLKCLAKEPHRRYESAEALADDLHRFLNREPIQARPVSALRRASLFYTRNPSLCNLVTVFLLIVVTTSGYYFNDLASKKAELEEKNTALSTSIGELEVKKKDAERQLLFATSRELAAQSMAELDRNPALSLLLARQSVLLTQRVNRPMLPIAYEALINSVAAVRGRPLDGHQEVVNFMTISPSGRKLVTCGWDGKVKAWDIEDGIQEPPEILVNNVWPMEAAYSSDDAWFAVSIRDDTTATVLLSRTSDPQTVYNLPDPGNQHHVLFSLDAKHLVTQSRTTRTSRIWDLTADDPSQHGVRLPTTNFKHHYCAAISPDSHWLATPDASGHNLHIWDLTAGRWERPALTLEGHENVVLSLAFSPDSHHLASGSRDNTIRLWEVEPGTMSQPRVLRGHNGHVQKVIFSPDGGWLASGSRDQTVRVWKLSLGGLANGAFAFSGHLGDVTNLAFHPTRSLLASVAAGDRILRIWNLEHPNPATTPLLLSGHLFPVNWALFAPDGRLFSSDAGGGVRAWKTSELQPRAVPLVKPTDLGRPVWDIGYRSDNMIVSLVESSSGTSIVTFSTIEGEDIQRQSQFHVSETNPRWQAISPDKRWFALTSTGQKVRLWKLPTESLETPELELGNTAFGASSVDFSPDSRYLAVTGLAGQICVFDLARNDPEAGCRSWDDFSNHGLSDAKFSPDGKTLATAYVSGAIRLWDFLSNEDDTPSFVELSGQTGLVRRLAYSPNGRQLAAGLQDGTIQVWDLSHNSHPELSLVLSGHTNRINGLAFNHSGTFLAATSRDKTASLWNLTADDPARSATTLTHEFATLALAFSPDDRFLSVGTTNGTLRTWNIETEQLLQRARFLAGRDFTPAERMRYLNE